ncbi:zinc-ribbon domain containing protein [uncultured Metabacillus sp.]|uniref:competence protein CoiA family protein n=1 Tax=uncultured Metabacillus sp. TaxID=2860135 RepID=UPI00262F5F4E|nr:zinc-ribbon domain containing protein [uncultured Metabacillus sp.]
MSYENVKLWFAKSNNNEIVTIADVDETNKKNTYFCPVCGSDLKPKAIKSKQITSHFAHVDSSKCNSESQVHFWFKHKFIEKGDNFTVVSDKERQYVCKDILVEKEYEISNGVYRPDVTVLTECGSTIYFEMAFSNKKKVRDYLDIWLELRNIVVEVDIKQLINKNEFPSFKALFYEGKCFNTKRNDTYYNTIGKYKEEKLKGEVDEELKERIRKLDWFWDDVLRYKNGEVDIDYMIKMINVIDNKDFEFINMFLNKVKCSDIMREYVRIKTETIFNILSSNIKDNFGEEYLRFLKYDIQYSRVFNKFEGSINYFNSKEKCWYINNIDRFNESEIIKATLKQMHLNKTTIERKKEIDKGNKSAEKIQKDLNGCSLLVDIYEKVKKRNKNYDLKVWVKSEKNCRLIDENDFLNGIFEINVTLSYDSITAEIFKFKHDKNKGIDNLAKEIVKDINYYFNKLEPLNNETREKIESLIVNLKENFNNTGTDITIRDWLEDTCEISITTSYRLSSYYFNNYGLIEDCRNDLVKLPFSRLNEIKNHLLLDASEKLINYYTRECYDCNNNFEISIGELKFFNKKGFDLPKRCKNCRNKRKQNKLN